MAKKPINARLSPVTTDAGQMPSDATVPSTYPTKPAKPTSTVSTLAAALRGPRSRVATMIISSTTNARKGQTARMCDFVTKVHPEPVTGNVTRATRASSSGISSTPTNRVRGRRQGATAPAPAIRTRPSAVLTTATPAAPSAGTESGAPAECARLAGQRRAAEGGDDHDHGGDRGHDQTEDGRPTCTATEAARASDAGRRASAARRQPDSRPGTSTVIRSVDRGSTSDSHGRRCRSRMVAVPGARAAMLTTSGVARPATRPTGWLPRRRATSITPESPPISCCQAYPRCPDSAATTS